MRVKGGFIMQIDRINLADLVVTVALGGALYLTIVSSQSDLSISIASGLLGYIGGSKVTTRRET